MVEKRHDYSLGFEETELRLGLPGDGEATKKRGFSETIDLKLKLQTVDSKDIEAEAEKMKRSASQKNLLACSNDPEKPPAPKYVLSPIFFKHIFFSGNNVLIP